MVLTWYLVRLIQKPLNILLENKVSGMFYNLECSDFQCSLKKTSQQLGPLLNGINKMAASMEKI